MAEAEKILTSLPDEERPLVLDQIASSCFYYRAMLEQCSRYTMADEGARRDIAPEVGIEAAIA